jgi:hypothetical protein
MNISRPFQDVWLCLADKTRMYSISTAPIAALTEKLIGIVALIACVQQFVQSARFCLLDSQDTAWLIRTGEYICKNGAVPVRDLFSWTKPESPFIAYQWLSECITWVVFNTGGLWLVGQFFLLLAGILYFWILPRQFLSRGLPATAAYGLLALVLTPSWLYARPQSFSYFLIIALQTILLNYQKTKTWKTLLPIPLLMLLWANLHSFWIFGLLMILAAGIKFLVRLPLVQIDRKLAIILFLSVVAICINPYGGELIQYNLSFPGNTDCSKICEVTPMQMGKFNGFFAYVVIYAYFMIKTLRTPSFYQVVIPSTFILAAVFMQRFEPIAVIVSWVHLADALTRVRAQLSVKKLAEVDRKAASLQTSGTAG